jgi:hypothetical protein
MFYQLPPRQHLSLFLLTERRQEQTATATTQEIDTRIRKKKKRKIHITRNRSTQGSTMERNEEIYNKTKKAVAGLWTSHTLAQACHPFSFSFSLHHSFLINHVPLPFVFIYEEMLDGIIKYRKTPFFGVGKPLAQAC